MAAPIDADGTSLEAQALQVAQALQALESAVVPVEGEEAPNAVSIAYDADEGNVTVGFTLPVTLTSSTAGLVLTAEEYV